MWFKNYGKSKLLNRIDIEVGNIDEASESDSGQNQTEVEAMVSSKKPMLCLLLHVKQKETVNNIFEKERVQFDNLVVTDEEITMKAVAYTE